MHCLIFCHTWLWWQWIWARKFESRHILIFEHVGSHCPQFSCYLNNWFCPYIWIFGYLLPTFFLGIWIFWSVDTPATLSYRIQFTSAEKIHVYLYVISHSWHLLWRTFVFWHGCKLTSFWLFCVDKCCNWKLRLSERQLFQQQKKEVKVPMFGRYLPVLCHSSTAAWKEVSLMPLPIYGQEPVCFAKE